MGEQRAVPSKTELKCKLCRHPERGHIDALLLKRSRREKDESGLLVNLEYVLAALRGLGVENPTEDNLKNHWKKHVSVMAADVVEKQEENRRERIAPGQAVDVDAVLDRIVAVGVSDLETLIEETGKSGVTVDQTLKALQLKTARKNDDATRQLMGSVATAIGGALAKKILPPAPKVIEAELVEEGEAVLVED